MKSLILLSILSTLTCTIASAETFQRSQDPLVRKAEQIWNQTAVENTRIGILPSTTSARFRMPLTVIRDAKSDWQWESIIPYIRKAEALFQQCDVKLSPITMVDLTHPGLADFSPSTDYLITKDLPMADAYRPMVIFNSGTNGFVYANADYYRYHDHPEFSKHTVFIDSLAIAMLGTKDMRAYFEGVMVHELLHTLLNVGHNSIPGNILNNTVTMGHEISKEQCEGLRGNPLVRPEL